MCTIAQHVSDRIVAELYLVGLIAAKHLDIATAHKRMKERHMPGLGIAAPSEYDNTARRWDIQSLAPF